MQIVKDRIEKELEWTEIRAAAPGIVTEVTADANSGFRVKIVHSGYLEGDDTTKVTTSYCHMKRYPLVQVGQYVGEGTILGYEGTTGKSLGYHCHTSYNFGGEPDSPVRYLYPFFTPFYYEEKALEEKEGAGSNDFLKSEYWTVARTVFPYGQVVEEIKDQLEKNKDHKGTFPGADDEVTKTVETDTLNGKAIIKIKNYVPQNEFLSDYTMLAKESEAPDLKKLPTSSAIGTNGDRSNWSGDILSTNPDYVDMEFIKKVEANNNKISGVQGSSLKGE
jgi:hypothetical protein